jgi:uncharacterized protein (DUF433 family)
VTAGDTAATLAPTAPVRSNHYFRANPRATLDGMDWKARVVIDPQVLVGKPLVKGTRLSVQFVVDLLAQGWSEQDVLSNYPGLTTSDIRACLAYASAVLAAEKVYPISA